MAQRQFDFGNIDARAKMLDQLPLVCRDPNHQPKVIHSSANQNYIGRRARGCGCAALVRMTLRALDTFQQKNEVCWPSVRTLAARANCTERKLQRGLKLAVEWGYLTIEYPSGGLTTGRDGRKFKATSNYKIAWQRIVDENGDPQFVTRPSTICHPSRVTNCHPERNSLKGSEYKHDETDQLPKAKTPGEKKRWRFHISPAQLRDHDYLIRSFAPRAAANGLIPAGRNGMTRLLGAAAVALARGDNPGGLFWTLLESAESDWLTTEVADDAWRRASKYYRDRPAIKA